MSTRPLPTSFRPLLLVLASAALAIGCDGEGTQPGAAIELSKTPGDGDAQTGSVAQPLPARVRVLVTDDGVPAEGISVGWSTDGGGSVTADGPTGTDGSATAVWTLGPSAGDQTARAVLEGASGSPVVFTATAHPGAPARLLQLGERVLDGRVGTALPEALQVLVRDDFGNAIAGVPVAWTVESGEAMVQPASGLTDDEGVSRAGVTLGASTGPSTIGASADGLAGSPARFVATARLYVFVEDSYFSPGELTVTAGTTVTWYWADALGEHNVVPDGEEPARSGNPVTSRSQYSYTFATPGTYRYYCQSHGFPLGAGMSGVVYVNP